MQQDITYIKKAVDELKESQKQYITRTEFWPVKSLVYGFVGLVLMGMVGLWVSSSLKTKSYKPATLTINQ